LLNFLIRTEDRENRSNICHSIPGIGLMRSRITLMVFIRPKVNKVWGGNLIYNERSVSIKTYVDYGLDKDPKEEFKVVH
jgi:hypothetical protein